jgi:hypothetical protein
MAVLRQLRERRQEGVASAFSRSGLARITPRLPAVLLQHAHIRHHHASIRCLAHVVDGEQADLHGGKGFHLDAGRAGGFHGCSTNNG